MLKAVNKTVFIRERRHRGSIQNGLRMLLYSIYTFNFVAVVDVELEATLVVVGVVVGGGVVVVVGGGGGGGGVVVGAATYAADVTDVLVSTPDI